MEKHRIFIVEDDPKIAALLADTLRKYQYEVETIKDFDSLMEQCLAFSPHIILLDINLPSYDVSPVEMAALKPCTENVIGKILLKKCNCSGTSSIGNVPALVVN